MALPASLCQVAAPVHFFTTCFRFLNSDRSFLHPKLLAAKPHAALHATPRSCAVARVMPVSCSFHTSGSTSCSPASQRAAQPTIAVLALDGGGLKGLLTLQMLKVRAVHTPTPTHTPTHARAHRQPRHVHRLETLRPACSRCKCARSSRGALAHDSSTHTNTTHSTHPGPDPGPDRGPDRGPDLGPDPHAANAQGARAAHGPPHPRALPSDRRHEHRRHTGAGHTG
eukprot:scaffold109450_cov69-Phaeocystis_antarctica.AAC.1